MPTTIELPDVRTFMVPKSQQHKDVPSVVVVDGVNVVRANLDRDIENVSAHLAALECGRAYFAEQERLADEAAKSARQKRIDKAAFLLHKQSTGIADPFSRIPDVYKRMASTLLDAVDSGEL